MANHNLDPLVGLTPSASLLKLARDVSCPSTLSYYLEEPSIYEVMEDASTCLCIEMTELP